MSTGERAVRDIVGAAVASQASHELPYFTRLARSGDSWVLWRLRHQRGRSGPLGFGLSEMATLATPVVWITLNEAAREFGSSAGDGIFAGVPGIAVQAPAAKAQARDHPAADRRAEAESPRHGTRGAAEEEAE